MSHVISLAEKKTIVYSNCYAHSLVSYFGLIHKYLENDLDVTKLEYLQLKKL